MTSTYRLLTDTISEGRDFIRLIGKLGQAEFQEKFAKIGRGAVLGVASSVMLVFALVFLLLGLAEFIIEKGFPPYLAFLSVGGGLVLMSLILGLAAGLSLRNVNLRPERTIEQIRRLSAAANEENPHDRTS
jgi:hypothetical protein